MIKSKSQTKTSGEDGVKRLRDELKRAGKSYVTIGIHDDAGQYPKGTPSVQEVALWNEFGTKDIPERSFIRSTVDENAAKFNQWQDEMATNIIEGWTFQKALEAVGLRIQFLIQNKIKSNVPPSNADSTRASKQRRGVGDRTLIDSGLLLRSVGFKVKVEK